LATADRHLVVWWFGGLVVWWFGGLVLDELTKQLEEDFKEEEKKDSDQNLFR